RLAGGGLFLRCFVLLRRRLRRLGLRKARIRLSFDPDGLPGFGECARDEILVRSKMRVNCMSCGAHACRRVVVGIARLAIARTRRDAEDGAARRKGRAAAVAGTRRLADHELGVAIPELRILRVGPWADPDQRDVRSDLPLTREVAGLVDAPA